MLHELKNDKGFTITEVLVAITLSSLVMAMIIGLATYSQKSFYVWQKKSLTSIQAYRLFKKMDKLVKDMREIEYCGEDSVYYLSKDGKARSIFVKDSTLFSDTTSIAPHLKISEFSVLFIRTATDTAKESTSVDITPYFQYYISFGKRDAAIQVMGGRRIW
ncbi:MAG: hypothetical protein A2268_11770 [Candidatus Raymondbacteria bacterium RifOxyA12_full_50_37]|uniref:Prepilin-type N-terminal cleavage/methylation domain-containing protein n=1 Tax=Candidatus Raymondbacteria bacterium RIFOXYD12_FULL_49_13 TaxID=1817890 RepID=A0A1F7FLK5_UNCRA|nr:MAG: hypothetical protein A2268_11770 [Candidatus Raymondbacteria bacterium RifOxyA12_full_50_37]OGJ98733.1 MAG: hypothetical protein A2453_08275 [Candidatus Raymondbacteria bacterium RIFOXYC2_FULL_50_21]OGK07451.1 MAG: hypothetical protein A2519_11170 [Candidatus Raymondbacteria bacterium RIFOXYD12_FULL_49_13]OGK07818.1 MAG: hypothetical protein A2487_00195 [Candidatus Raymondbacteria bacterium RifOxyC12_full_50_8]OGP43896.1 MAG: hypothetical protein A2324_05230 [Candidatus Raymondbacteria 